MLDAQRKEFEEKKKDESPYPRDFEHWNALDYFRRPRYLRAQRFYFTLGATILALLASLVSAIPALHRTHQSGALSTAHATLANDCASCHDQSLRPLYDLFDPHSGSSTSDESCKKCHKLTTGVHHPNASSQPTCAACHREHRGRETLANHVVDRNCTECHRDLGNHILSEKAKRFHPTITAFNRDHPEFAPSAKGKKDPSRLKFNHKAHLDLDIDALRKAGATELLAGLSAKMDCANCHQMDGERRYFKPIQYDNHCARCHALNVPLVGDFAPDLKAAQAAFSKIPAPHKEPAVVRGVLRDRFVAFAQTHNLVGKAQPSVPRPLPWKNVTDEQWNWASDQAKKAETVLFMNKQWQKTEPLTWCSHCHIEQTPRPADGLPVYEKILIPSRWYTHSVFNHGSHRTMACIDCHDQNAARTKVAMSQTASDILLPTLQTCQKCHSPTGGARNACVECHRYHER